MAASSTRERTTRRWILVAAPVFAAAHVYLLFVDNRLVVWLIGLTTGVYVAASAILLGRIKD